MSVSTGPEGTPPHRTRQVRVRLSRCRPLRHGAPHPVNLGYVTVRRHWFTLAAAVPVLLAYGCAQPTAEPAAVDPTLGPATSVPDPSAATDDGIAASAVPTHTTAAPARTATAPPDTPSPPPPPPDLAGVRLAVEQIADLDAPTAMAVRPGDDTLYVAERAGRILPVTEDGSVGDPIVDIRESTVTDGERGLLGLAWSPDGGRLFVSSTDTEGATRLEAFEVTDGIVRAESRTELLRVPQPASNHNGGDVHIGPDGLLWLGLGDGGAANDRFGNGQNPDTLLGTMVRIDPTAQGYDVPGDNPFVEGEQGAPEVWAYGLRNPWRFSFDSLTGQLWIADVGQNAVEEINRVDPEQPGLNFGWPRFEGDRPFDGQPAEGPVVDPVHVYDHGRGCSITGGYVYRGQAIPDLAGAYLYSDFCNGQIFALAVDDDGQVLADTAVGASVDQPVSFGEGPDGELYVLSLNGPLYRITQG